MLFSGGMIAFVHYKQWADLQALKNRKTENAQRTNYIKYVEDNVEVVEVVKALEKSLEEREALTPQQRANWEELERQKALKLQLEK